MEKKEKEKERERKESKKEVGDLKMPNRDRLELYSYFSPSLETLVLRVSLSSLTYWQAAAPNLLPPVVPVRYPTQ